MSGRIMRAMPVVTSTRPTINTKGLLVLMIVASLTFLALGSVPRHVDFVVRPFVSTSYGIYLVHPLVVAFLQVVFVRLRYQPGPWEAVGLALPVFMGCALAIRGARWLGAPEWLVPRG